MFVRLSHTLRLGGPAFGRTSNLVVEQQHSIAQGDTHHGFMIHVYNHDGTHLDAPYHFNATGKRIADLDLGELVFDAPLVLDIPKTKAALITREELRPHGNQIAACDLLMIRTGYCRFRDSDTHKYSYDCPCFAPDASRYLIEECLNVRGLAVDSVSVGSPRFPSETVETHRILTGHPEYSSRYILIFEDVNMDFDLSSIRRVIALPLFVEEIDGSPCTIIAELS